MTEAEIIMLYRQAADKKKQIRILSDLTLLSVSAIIDLLTAHGETIPRRKHHRPTLRKGSVAREYPEQIVIKAAREATGLTQVELGTLLGVSNCVISNWEQGIRPADWDKLRDVLPDLPDWDGLRDVLSDLHNAE